MKRVQEIKARREKAFYRNRMVKAGVKAKSRAADKLAVHKAAHLRPALEAESSAMAADCEKIKVKAKSKAKSALVGGEGQSM